MVNIAGQNKITVYDLLEQLLAHNFLETLEDSVNFWHSSFRDFFAAQYICNYLPEAKWEIIESKQIPLLAAFILAETPEDHEIRRKLIGYAMGNRLIYIGQSRLFGYSTKALFMILFGKHQKMTQLKH